MALESKEIRISALNQKNNLQEILEDFDNLIKEMQYLNKKYHRILDRFSELEKNTDSGHV